MKNVKLGVFAISLLFIILLILFSALAYAQDSVGSVECDPNLKGVEPRSSCSGKGLLIFDKSINPGNDCVPISAAISSDWFKRICGVEYKVEGIEAMIKRLKELMGTTEEKGTSHADIYTGLRKFINDQQLQDCFTVEVYTCKRALKFFNDTDLTTNMVDEKDSYNVDHCPDRELVKDLMKKKADVLLNLHLGEIDHMVGVNGIGNEKLSANNDGLAEDFDIKNILPSQKGLWLGGKKNKMPTTIKVTEIFAIVPKKDCPYLINCPEPVSFECTDDGLVVDRSIGSIPAPESVAIDQKVLPEFPIFAIPLIAISALLAFFYIRRR